MVILKVDYSILTEKFALIAVCLLSEAFCRISRPDFKAVPPITFAACYGNVSEVQRLLDAGVDPNVRDWLYQTPLHMAAKFGRMGVVRLLVERGAYVNARNRDYQETPLHLAAKIGHIEMIKFLIRNGARVNAAISNKITPGGTPLMYATSYANSVDAVDVLVQLGALINVTNSYPQSPLHHAVEHNNIDLVYNLLAKHRINKEIRDEFGNTALNWLVKLYAPPQAAMAKLLIESGADIESKDRWERSPLHNAAIYGLVEIAAWLIRRGAVVDQRDVFGRTPLYSAATFGQGPTGKVVRLLLKHGADPNSMDIDGCDTPLFGLVRNFHKRNSSSEVVGIARQLLYFGANASVKDPCAKMTPLNVAKKTLQWDVAELLSDKQNSNLLQSSGNRSSIDSFDVDTVIPDLHLASSIGDVRGVIWLIEQHNRSVNERDYRGQMPLHLAAQNGHATVALVLLQHGARASARDKSGRTPLHNAASIGHTGLIFVLTRYGADVGAVTNDGAAPIHYAIDFRNSSEAIQALLARGADPTQKLMPDRMTPLHMAAANQNFHFMQILLENGADINAENVNGATPLNHLAMSNCCYPQIPVLGYLLDHGAYIDAVNNRGWTALHMAIVSKKRYHVIEYLLHRGANPNSLDANGCNTPLFLLVSSATANGRNDTFDVADLLVRYGARHDQVDGCAKMSPLEKALLTKQNKVAYVLRAAKRHLGPSVH